MTDRVMMAVPFKNLAGPPATLEEGWSVLSSTIESQCSGLPVPLPKERLFQLVTDLCFYRDFREVLYARLQEKVAMVSEQAVAEMRVSLEDLVQRWEALSFNMHIVRTIFSCLERVHLPSSFKSIKDLFHTQLRQSFLRHPDLLTRVIQESLQVLEERRQGRTGDSFCSFLTCLQALDLYHSHFEEEYLKAIKVRYLEESAQQREQLSVCEYINYVEMSLAQEECQALQFLDMTTQASARNILKEVLIADKLEFLINIGVKHLFHTDNVLFFGKLLQLCKEVQHEEWLFQQFGEQLTAAGLEAIRAPQEIVLKLLDLQQRVQLCLVSAFEMHPLAKKHIKTGWEFVMNAERTSMPEKLAKQFHKAVKASNHNMLQSLIELFKHVPSKDIFEAVYFKKLAKRVLVKEQTSFEAEKFVLNKLEEECGSGFTHKIQQLLGDVEASRSALETASSDMPDATASFSVLALGEEPWVPAAVDTVRLPMEYVTFQELFQAAYCKLHSTRVLLWRNSMTQCELEAHFPSNTYILSVSLYQAVVLLYFNDHDSASIAELEQATNMPSDTIIKAVEDLTSDRQLLLKSQEEIGPDTRLCYNAEFSCNRGHIQVSTLQLDGELVETQQSPEQLNSEQVHALQALIVKFMKARKKAPCVEIEKEAVQRLSAQASMVRTQVDILVKKEYLAIDPKDSDIFHYVP